MGLTRANHFLFPEEAAAICFLKKMMRRTFSGQYSTTLFGCPKQWQVGDFYANCWDLGRSPSPVAPISLFC
jgi:hypothetical protein